MQLSELEAFFRAQPDVEFAVLVGSRASGTANSGSDWDIALRLQGGLSSLHELARVEELRSQIAANLQVDPALVDLIHVPSTKLAMRERIANHGLVLSNPDALPWLHFLQRTWRDLEDCYWDELYAS